MKKYDPQVSEAKWRQFWEEHSTFKTDLKGAKNPFYNLMMFPYPSGDGLHIGHVFSFGGADTYGRFKMMQGHDVFEPMGFDAFGIHSENFAIKKNVHPKKLTEETTTYFREEQLKKLGALFAWDHELNTTDPNYYRWTQWLFLKLYSAKLAVKKSAPVPWCPSCKTVLADEQVSSGKCERCSSEVIQKNLSQWFFKITNYTERLLNNLSLIDWSKTTLEMQKNWIGKSEGVEIDFATANDPDQKIIVFTTRPETIYGATFLVLAPEHPLVTKLGTEEHQEKLSKYINEVQNKSEVARMATVREKTGVFTGSYVKHPLKQELIPVYVADYVLLSYGTGAVMGVPAHDSRDWDFAIKYKIDIVSVIRPRPAGPDSNDGAYTGEGVLINSGDFDDLGSQEAKKIIAQSLDNHGQGRIKTQYHLRDWLISRQRYWGPPIPIIYCRNCWEENVIASQERNEGRGNLEEIASSQAPRHDSGSLVEGWDYTVRDGKEYMIRPVPEKDLPVLLPEVEDFKPMGTGKSPLANVASFVKTTCPKCGHEAERETDVSDTFLDSSWYFLRYPSIDSAAAAFDPEVTKKWLPVNSYIGGNEHAVLHLLYSRFITMVLSDLGYLNFEEPFTKFRAHGFIIHSGAKMSKSRGNVINPNQYIEKFGADTLRMYLLFLGPYEIGGDFQVKGIGGIARFLNRIVAMMDTQAQSDDKHTQLRHQVIKKVTADLENLHFNTAIASLMEYLNTLTKNGSSTHDRQTLIKLLSPLAPFFSEEIWQTYFGSKPFESVHHQDWPHYDEASLQTDSFDLVLQVNGKFRGKIKAISEANQEELERLALDHLTQLKYIEKDNVVKTIFVQGKLVNFVTK